MKNRKSIFSVFVLVLAVYTSSFKKDPVVRLKGDTCAQGPAGVQGSQGTGHTR